MKLKNTLGVAACIAAIAGTSKAEPTIEFMVQQAAGLLHHSCNSLVEETGGDEDTIVEVVKKMVAVSLINRQVDLEKYAGTDEEKDALRASFVEELKAGCAADRDALLAGIVDASVKKVLGL